MPSKPLSGGLKSTLFEYVLGTLGKFCIVRFIQVLLSNSFISNLPQLSISSIPSIYLTNFFLYLAYHHGNMDQLTSAVLYSPMSFYDTTPLGRILNRFSKDMYTIDEQLPNTVRMYIITIARITLAIFYTCILTPLFVIGLVPVIYFYRVSQAYYIKTSRELTRLENTSRSPIYALFSETLDGLATIRAYKSERRLTKKNNTLLDQNQSSYFLNFSSNCW